MPSKENSQNGSTDKKSINEGLRLVTNPTPPPQSPKK